MTQYVKGLMALGLIMAVAASPSAADPGKAAGKDPGKDPSKIDRLDRMLGLARIWAEVKSSIPRCSSARSTGTGR